MIGSFQNSKQNWLTL